MRNLKTKPTQNKGASPSSGRTPVFKGRSGGAEAMPVEGKARASQLGEIAALGVDLRICNSSNRANKEDKTIGGT